MRQNGISITMLLLLAFVACAPASDVVDRIVAIVNGKLILQSDVEQEVHMEAFLAGQQASNFKPEELQSVVERMIDRQLVHEQMRSVREVATTSQSVERRMRQFRDSLGKSAESDAGWEKVLADAGVTEEQFRAHFADEVQTMRFLEARLRPQIQVDAAAIETYYREKLLPEMRKSGEKEPSLAEVSPRIREILIEQKLDESLTQWLKSLRDQSSIRIPKQIESNAAVPIPQAQ
jgi:peptidyl-prolyl cis-trans isomerase SurA